MKKKILTKSAQIPWISFLVVRGKKNAMFWFKSRESHHLRLLLYFLIWSWYCCKGHPILHQRRRKPEKLVASGSDLYTPYFSSHILCFAVCTIPVYPGYELRISYWTLWFHFIELSFYVIFPTFLFSTWSFFFWLSPENFSAYSIT